MILQLNGYMLNVEFRNGFGLDLESTDSRPVSLLAELEDGEPVMTIGFFDGLIVLIPFVILMFGRCYVISETETESE